MSEFSVSGITTADGNWFSFSKKRTTNAHGDISFDPDVIAGSPFTMRLRSTHWTFHAPSGLRRKRPVKANWKEPYKIMTASFSLQKTIRNSFLYALCIPMMGIRQLLNWKGSPNKEYGS